MPTTGQVVSSGGQYIPTDEDNEAASAVSSPKMASAPSNSGGFTNSAQLSGGSNTGGLTNSSQLGAYIAPGKRISLGGNASEYEAPVGSAPPANNPYLESGAAMSPSESGTSASAPWLDDGGEVPDPEGAIPADPDDPGQMQDTSTADQDTSDQGQPDAQSGGQSDSGSAYDKVLDAYEFGQNQLQQTAMMPSKPAGPGGDQPNNNPFPTRTPAIPFGKLSDSGSYQVAAADQRPIPPKAGVGIPQPGKFNPRDYLPGGPGTSQGQTNTMSLAAGGPVPDDVPPEGRAQTYTTRYDDGGSVQAIPSSPDDTTSGADMDDPTGDMSPVQQGQPQNAPGVQSAQGAQNPQSQTSPALEAYIRGSDGASPQELQSFERQVDPSGQMTQGDKTVAAIASQPDPQSAYKVMQGYRARYSAYNAFARAAATGSSQQKPDINAATVAATKANGYLPDGNHVSFTPTPGGVTATVIDPSGDAKAFNLSQQAFQRYLAKDGQFDNLMQNDSANVLSKLSQISTSSNSPTYPGKAGGSFVGANGQPQTAQQFNNSPQNQQARAGWAKREDATVNHLKTMFDPQDVEIAMQRFPNAVVNQGDMNQALDWLEGQKQQSKQNTIAATRAKNPFLINQDKLAEARYAVDTRAGAEKYAADQRRAGVQDTNAAKLDMNKRTALAQLWGHGLANGLKPMDIMRGIAEDGDQFAKDYPEYGIGSGKQLMAEFLKFQGNPQAYIQGAPSPQQGGQTAPAKGASGTGRSGWQFNKALGLYKGPDGKFYNLQGQPAAAPGGQ